jgi:hypothetical protein
MRRSGEMKLKKTPTHTRQSIMTKSFKAELINLLRVRNYLSMFGKAMNSNPLPSNKVPYTWLMRSICTAHQKGGPGLVPFPEGGQFSLVGKLAIGKNEDFLEMFMTEINCQNHSKHTGQPEQEPDIQYTERFIVDSWKLQLYRESPSSVSKAELFELIKHLFPEYCPPDMCMAPIQAAHRSWYIIILMIALTSSSSVVRMTQWDAITLITEYRQSKTDARKPKGLPCFVPLDDLSTKLYRIPPNLSVPTPSPNPSVHGHDPIHIPPSTGTTTTIPVRVPEPIRDHGHDPIHIPSSTGTTTTSTTIPIRVPFVPEPIHIPSSTGTTTTSTTIPIRVPFVPEPIRNPIPSPVSVPIPIPIPSPVASVPTPCAVDSATIRAVRHCSNSRQYATMMEIITNSKCS